MSALASTFSAVTSALADKAKAQAFEQLEDPTNQDKAVEVILSAPIPHEEKLRIAAALKSISEKVIATPAPPPAGAPTGGTRRRHLRRARRTRRRHS
jgi:hypothetical protein